MTNRIGPKDNITKDIAWACRGEIFLTHVSDKARILEGDLCLIVSIAYSTEKTPLSKRKWQEFHNRSGNNNRTPHDLAQNIDW